MPKHMSTVKVTQVPKNMHMTTVKVIEAKYMSTIKISEVPKCMSFVQLVIDIRNS